MAERSVMKGRNVKYGEGYCTDLETIRKQEYPQIKKTIYLDHAGTTLYAKSMIDSFSQEMVSNLFGNPHSMSLSSQRSTKRIEEVRRRALDFFNADPDDYDLVFVANATSAIKLVGESLRELGPQGFWYGYHVDSHTSLVGVRELAKMGYQCLRDDDVDNWISNLDSDRSGTPQLLAFPAQSNLNGRRLPIRWCKEIRAAASEGRMNVFSLLDASSLVSTAPLHVSECAPDFVAVSFYKIFGFPDLGALIVRKSAARALEKRKFFGGGTVNMVLVSDLPWHAKKTMAVHERLEDGTLPFHSIIALDTAFHAHKRLYGSMANISAHTGLLAKRLYERLSSMTHFNHTKVCQIYQSSYGNPSLQGPIIAFNLKNSQGGWIPKTDIERLAAARDIQLRSGSVCNPGGTASCLGWKDADLRRHYAAGLRCGDSHDVLDGRPTGIVRVSLGAMTNVTDINAFIQFIEEVYVEKAPPVVPSAFALASSMCVGSRYFVESLTVFPIKGCGAFQIPEDVNWEITRHGLAWDQEWCLVHEKTGKVLDRNAYPQMALIHPAIYPSRGVLCISDGLNSKEHQLSIEIPLDLEEITVSPANVAGFGSEEKKPLHSHISFLTSTFLYKILGVRCTLVRTSSRKVQQRRLPRPTETCRSRMLRLFRIQSSEPDFVAVNHDNNRRSHLLLDDSARIMVPRKSGIQRIACPSGATATNAQQRSALDNAVTPDMFRANIVVAERSMHEKNAQVPQLQQDQWSSIRIGQDFVNFDVLKGIQSSLNRRHEQTKGVGLGKSPLRVMIRQVDGSILLGRYTVSPPEGCLSGDWRHPTIAVRDAVLPVLENE
ncbi:hypothetical protein N7523_005608 [Penicillium sp. IBT 18751x]|nr:hypothetical protein N7523_005800 [Penicillium sp. IBT 18751x]KAJ6117857.1 hypothetical protein N7523_005608 [Penicillium sp. IBT 18751x]